MPASRPLRGRRVRGATGWSRAAVGTATALSTALALRAVKAPALAGDLLSHQLKGKTDAIEILSITAGG